MAKGDVTVYYWYLILPFNTLFSSQLKVYLEGISGNNDIANPEQIDVQFGQIMINDC